MGSKTHLILNVRLLLLLLTTLKKGIPNDAALVDYLEPQWRWIEAFQNDFAARADWCVKSFQEANHAPVVKVDGALGRDMKPGETLKLAAIATDPDDDALTYRWWQYEEADSAESSVKIKGTSDQQASFVVPDEVGKQVHTVLEVVDDGTPGLTCYQRVVCTIR